MLPAEILDAVNTFGKATFSSAFSVLTSDQLSGGCINHVHKLSTSSGDFCIKFNLSSSFPNMFECEASGLELLREAGALRVPSVVLTGEEGQYSFILLEYISQGRRMIGFMEDFGRALALQHKQSEDYFGLDHNNYMGSLPQSNEQHDNWASFFAQERLKRQADLAISNDLLNSRQMLLLERLCSKLKDILPNEPPSLLHGDLWNGNYMVDANGKPVLIDPAVYYGNREADLAMTLLFGGFDDDFYAAYHESYPLLNGWRKRVPVYQLYPLLIHLNIFGKGYLGSVEEVLETYA